ncbi:PPE domain-containing protein [Mycobacterium leprae]|uniref:PPE domain-containing protein n=1 Tax=Mycobacterium leprae TaxID=1769 RepID=A0AAD0KRN5_MYCLR|nr:PPE domain-containing protein [Mycobacterium leprae]OAR19738.1 hypothetical protein A8144_13410 [Mycobacterium leprae 3125609]OAX70541.1 hypothetical protein A3216_11440 [Mycobacterium leprae 7935681]
MQGLVQSDLFGENALAIVAREAQYTQFWAWNAKAMGTYAIDVLNMLSKVTSWPKSPEITIRPGWFRGLPQSSRPAR